MTRDRDDAARDGAGGYADEPHDPDCDPPLDVVEPAAVTSCLVLSSPHSGCRYTARFLASTRLDPIGLRRSEDAFVDRLFAGAVALGMPMLRAHFPRAFLDVNREPYELDPRMFEGRLPAFVNSRSIRVAGGLGTIARVVGEAQEIYARRLTVEEGIARIEQLYKPYHATLQDLLRRAQRRFGAALLIDCHSMPSHYGVATSAGRDDRLKADMVIGDRYGTSCHPAIVGRLVETLTGLGYSVERNKPYAGGFITEHYGRPGQGCHAVQIEVNRALYMDEVNIRPVERFDRVARDLCDAMRALSESMDGRLRPGLLAAE